jgi:hypothetical protein
MLQDQDSFHNAVRAIKAIAKSASGYIRMQYSYMRVRAHAHVYTSGSVSVATR